MSSTGQNTDNGISLRAAHAGVAARPAFRSARAATAVLLLGFTWPAVAESPDSACLWGALEAAIESAAVTVLSGVFGAPDSGVEVDAMIWEAAGKGVWGCLTGVVKQEVTQALQGPEPAAQVASVPVPPAPLHQPTADPASTHPDTSQGPAQLYTYHMWCVPNPVRCQPTVPSQATYQINFQLTPAGGGYEVIPLYYRLAAQGYQWQPVRRLRYPLSRYQSQLPQRTYFPPGLTPRRPFAQPPAPWGPVPRLGLPALRRQLPAYRQEHPPRRRGGNGGRRHHSERR